jgi:hypothetical protein
VTAQVIDLDARRAQAGMVARKVRVSGVEFDLPAVITAVQGKVLVASASTNDDVSIIDALAAVLFGDRAEEAKELMTADELLEVVQSYGTGLGELQASSKPSKNTGNRSKRTSSSSTG